MIEDDVKHIDLPLDIEEKENLTSTEEDDYDVGPSPFGDDPEGSDLDEFGLGQDDDDSDAPEQMDKKQAKTIFDKQ